MSTRGLGVDITSWSAHVYALLLGRRCPPKGRYPIHAIGLWLESNRAPNLARSCIDRRH
jgi:hypothetical protein